jgi:hypothetical protein
MINAFTVSASYLKQADLQNDKALSLDALFAMSETLNASFISLYFMMLLP